MCQKLRLTAFSFIFTVSNISGVAAVLELARQFVESHCKPKNTIIFATFDLEEMGGQVRHIFNQLIISEKNKISCWKSPFFQGKKILELQASL